MKHSSEIAVARDARVFVRLGTMASLDGPNTETRTGLIKPLFLAGYGPGTARLDAVIRYCTRAAAAGDQCRELPRP